MKLKVAKVVLVSLLLGLALCPVAARAQSSASEYQVKAAFLYNFLKFVEWPTNTFAAADSPITIGIAGESPFGGDLEATIKGKTINGRPLVVRYFNSSKDAGLKRCQVVFICKSERKRLDEIMVALKGTSILTVSEMEPFLGAGGMINFFMDENKVRFEINDAAVKQAGLGISSKLMNLAKRKEREP